MLRDRKDLPVRRLQLSRETGRFFPTDRKNLPERPEESAYIRRRVIRRSPPCIPPQRGGVTRTKRHVLVTARFRARGV